MKWFDITNRMQPQASREKPMTEESVFQGEESTEVSAVPLEEGAVEIDTLNPGGGVFQRLSDVKPKAIESIASGYLQVGEITLLGGDGGVGKGQIVAQIAKSVTTGEPTEFFPQPPKQPGNVVILSGEDPVDSVLLPRMAAAGVNLDRVMTLDMDSYYRSRGKMPYLDDPEFMNLVVSGDPMVLVVDPVQACLSDAVNMNNRQDVRKLMQELHMLAQRYGFAVLLVMHTNKNPGAYGRKRLNGSADLWDAARNVLMMGRVRNDGKFYLSHEKSSYTAPADTILFTTESVEIGGVGTVKAVFDSTTEWKDEDFVREKPERVAGKYDDVQKTILAMLVASPEKQMVSDELKALAMKKTGCSESTYNHARSALKRGNIIDNSRRGAAGGGGCWFTVLGSKAMSA